jgi:hypothetical protein
VAAGAEEVMALVDGEATVVEEGAEVEEVVGVVEATKVEEVVGVEEAKVGALEELTGTTVVGFFDGRPLFLGGSIDGESGAG